MFRAQFNVLGITMKVLRGLESKDLKVHLHYLEPA